MKIPSEESAQLVSCEKCQKSFKTSQGLLSHKKVHIPRVQPKFHQIAILDEILPIKTKLNDGTNEIEQREINSESKRRGCRLPSVDQLFREAQLEKKMKKRQK